MSNIDRVDMIIDATRSKCSSIYSGRISIMRLTLQMFKVDLMGEEADLVEEGRDTKNNFLSRHKKPKKGLSHDDKDYDS